MDLNIKLRLIHQASTEGVLHGIVGTVDTQLAEDVLTMGVDGVDAGETLSGYFLGGLA